MQYKHLLSCKVGELMTNKMQLLWLTMDRDSAKLVVFPTRPSMKNLVEFVAADLSGVIQRETWQKTRLACNKCAQNHGNVWILTSSPPIQAQGLEFRLFICISCQFTFLGLPGFRPKWDVPDRIKQIIQYGFPEEAEIEKTT